MAAAALCAPAGPTAEVWESMPGSRRTLAAHTAGLEVLSPGVIAHSWVLCLDLSWLYTSLGDHSVWIEAVCFVEVSASVLK